MIEGIFLLKKAGYKAPMLSVDNLIRKKNVKYVREFLRFCSKENIEPNLEISCTEDNLSKERQLLLHLLFFMDRLLMLLERLILSLRTKGHLPNFSRLQWPP